MRWYRLFLLIGGALFAQPPNDNCQNATLVQFGASGFSTGTFTTAPVAIQGATLQPGEFIPQGNPNGLSVWWKFYLPTTRSVRIILRQVGNVIPSNRAGWALYATNNCLPGATHLVDPPIQQMEGYTHICLRQGWYLVQVTVDNGAWVNTGQVYLDFEVAFSSAGGLLSFDAYDTPHNAQNLGTLNSSCFSTLVRDAGSWDVGCQSIYEGEHTCSDPTYSKSTWHVFRTDNAIDWLGISLEESPWNTNNTAARPWRVRIYQGDIRNGTAGLTPVTNCLNLTQTSSQSAAWAEVSCLLQPNTTYSLQILYPTSYFGKVHLRLYERGHGLTQSPSPLTIPAAYQLTLPLNNTTLQVQDYFTCASRIALNRCNPTVAGADEIDGRDLAWYFTFTISAYANVSISATSSCGCAGTPRLRIFQGSGACDLSLYTTVDGGATLRCMPAGTYLVQVLGQSGLSGGNLREICGGGALGLPIQVTLSAQPTPAQNFGLHVRPQEADLINGGNPLAFNTVYTAQPDRFDCRTTVLPAGDLCNDQHNRAIYRIIQIEQQGILVVSGDFSRFRYRLYRGDARTVPIVNGRLQGLQDQAGCQGYIACNFQYMPFKVCVSPGTYTLVTFGSEANIGEGDQPTVELVPIPSPHPLFTTPATAENMGTLSNATPLLTATETYFSCIDNPNTITIGGNNYPPCNNSTKLIYREFYLEQAGMVRFTDMSTLFLEEGGVEYRIFRGRISNNTLTALERDCFMGKYPCTAHGGFTACMEPGWYTVVAYGIEGRTWTNPSYTTGRGGSIGNRNRFRIELLPVQEQFGLRVRPDQADLLNGGNPLVAGTLPNQGPLYTATPDQFDCAVTPLPAGDVCHTSNNRAMYRVFQVNQSGILVVNPSCNFFTRLYRGDARTEPMVGDRIQNLIDQACCQSCLPFKVCVTPGTYTLVTFGNNWSVGSTDQPSVRFYTIPAGHPYFRDRSASDPNPPENMGTLSLANPTLTATPTYFTCLNNPYTITIGATNYPPCNGATKMVYREFYLANAGEVTFTDLSTGLVGGGVVYRTFRGRISNGSLTGLVKDCHTNYTACLQPGWYTVVAYGFGTACQDRGGAEGILNSFQLSLSTRVQLYGTLESAYRPSAPLDYRPFPGCGTPYAPVLDTTYTLPAEQWVCTDNLPFPNGITPCNNNPAYNRITYRIIELTKPAYVYLYGFNPFPGGYQSRLYAGDLSVLNPPYTVVIDCFSDAARYCWLAPGRYTLVTFAHDAHNGYNHGPVYIYVDSVGHSRYNYAARAYDFGQIPADGVEYRTRPGQTPPGPYGRHGSNDFIFCTTDAFTSDPVNTCPIGEDVNPTPLPGTQTNRRRNLWYTFTLDGAGTARIRVEALTRNPNYSSCEWWWGGGKGLTFSVYSSDDVDFNPPTVVDSTIAQGLTLVGTSQIPFDCCWQHGEITIFRDPCENPPPTRYYLIVERNSCFGEPNIQVEVGIRYEPATGVFVRYDRLWEANQITGNPTIQCNPPYTLLPLPEGTYTGCEGDLTCATRTAEDPAQGCFNFDKTIWYSFVSDITGWVYINYDRPGTGQYLYDGGTVQLFWEVVPGDPSSLMHVPLAAGLYNHPTLGERLWGRACVQGGARYYIRFTNCQHEGRVIPRIWLQKHPGDFCRDSLTILMTNPGTSYTATMRVDCFTMGGSPGEDLPTIGCMGSPTGQKSAWVLVRNTFTDTLDVDIRLVENTTATENEFRYRILAGNCGGVYQEECVFEGGFIILHLKCRPPGSSFWVHVLMPEWATGTLNVEVTPAIARKPCRPSDPTCPLARFDFTPRCVGEPIQFLNYSSVGPDVSYTWHFGDGAGSSLFEPQHTYTTPGTYEVKLIVEQNGCKDTARRNITIYRKPGVNVTFTPESPVWVGVPITFTPTYTDTIPGTGPQILWDFCASGSEGCGSSLPDYTGVVPPQISYDSPGMKRVCVRVSNGAICDSLYCFWVEVVLPPIYSGGPYDGASLDGILSTCPTIWSGGPYDGASMGALYECLPPPLPPYTGGPYDGSEMGILLASCPQPNYAGGPYDGTESGALWANCPLPNYAGGPYDGADAYRLAALTVYDTFACRNSPAAIRASMLVDWYLTPSGGTPIATNTSILNISSLPESRYYYAQNSCTPSRVPALVIARERLRANLWATPGPYCRFQPITFVNQTLVSGTSQPTIGTLLTALAPTGTPPNPGQISFSSGTANFNLLANGVHDNGSAWTAGNTGAGTVWVQWHYFSPRSVNRIVFWNCASCWNAGARAPVRGRLYFHDGTAWRLIKFFTFPYPSTANYDSGHFTDTEGVFARRWKLELDVEAANAPAWGEFQIYASAPVPGGNVAWNCGAGWVQAQTTQCSWGTEGTYLVRMAVNAPGACPDTIAFPITIAPCGPLPAIISRLTAHPTQSAHVQLLWHTNTPIRRAYLEKWQDTGWVRIYVHEVPEALNFVWIDSFPTFEGINLYRVLSEHADGNRTYSNVAEVAFAQTAPSSSEFVEFLRAFPNPVEGKLTIQFGIAQEREIALRICDTKGATVAHLTPHRYAAGFHEIIIDTRSWTSGIYTLHWFKDGIEETRKVLKMVP